MSAMQATEEKAFAEFVRCRKHFQGGNLGDLYRASGRYLEKDVNNFLETLEQNNVGSEELGNFVLMLPLELVDDIEAKRAAIQIRIQKVESADASPLKGQALQILKDELKFLASIESLK